MKKILTLTAVTIFGFAYEGCGVNKKEALNNLSSTIYVNINSKFHKEQKLKVGFFDDSYKETINNEVTQTSVLTLKNVKYVKKNNQICAIISKDDVKKSAEADLLFLESLNIDNLPDDFNAKQKEIEKILPKISFVKAVLKLDKNRLKKLNKLETELKNFTHKGVVTFSLNIPNAKIKIAGQNGVFTPSTPILLPADNYSYKIEAEGKCPIEGSFKIEAKKIITISKNLENYPIIKFSSNKDNVLVKLDGKVVKLDEPQILKRCNGTAVWSMSFENQKEQGSIQLEAGLEKSIEKSFISLYELKKLQEKIEFYTHSAEITINYGYGFSDKKEWDDEKRLEFRKFNNYGVVKFSFGILTGSQGEWTAKEMNELEMAIGVRLQLPSAMDTIFHISKVPIIPYIGVEGGWDFYKFIDSGDLAIGDITSILRGTAGVTFLFNKQLGLNIEYSKDFATKEDNIITAGLVLSF